MIKKRINQDNSGSKNRSRSIKPVQLKHAGSIKYIQLKNNDSVIMPKQKRGNYKSKIESYHSIFSKNIEQYKKLPEEAFKTRVAVMVHFFMMT